MAKITGRMIELSQDEYDKIQTSNVRLSDAWVAFYRSDERGYIEVDFYADVCISDDLRSGRRLSIDLIENNEEERYITAPEGYPDLLVELKKHVESL